MHKLWDVVSKLGVLLTNQNEAYRQESLSEAQDIYAGITSPDTNAFSEEDLLVNKTALHALATWSKEHVPGIDYPEPSDNNQFEALYNYASIALARGGVDEANTLLQLAKGMHPAYFPSSKN